jgi:hypothetical protein
VRPLGQTPGVRTRTPSIGSTSPRDEGGCLGPTESQVPSQPGHRFADYENPPCQGDGPPHPATRLPPTAHEALPPTYERMPLTNLCSRLVVTSTRWNPPLPSLGLSPCRPPRPASRIPSDLRPSFHAPSSTATPNSRCRHLRPWVATHSVLRHQLLPASPPLKVARCPERSAHAGVIDPTQAQ